MHFGQIPSSLIQKPEEALVLKCEMCPVQQYCDYVY